MKLQLTFKTPGVVDNVVEDECDDERERLLTLEEIDLEYLEQRLLEKEEWIRGIVNQWVRYGELVTIEIDTTENTATVLRVPERNQL